MGSAWHTRTGASGARWEVLLCSGTADLLDREPSDANAHTADAYARRVASMSGRSAHEWLGAPSRAAAERILSGVDVWEAGRAAMAELRSGMEMPTAASVRREVVWCDDGDELDVDRMMSGQLDTAWRRTRRRVQPSGTAHVRLIVRMGAGGGVAADALRWTGVAAAALCDVLESSGRRVELTVASVSERLFASGVRDALLIVPLKRYGDPMAVDRVLAWAGHASALRIAEFGAMYAHPRRVLSGLGFAGEPAPVWRDLMGDPGEGVIFVPALRSREEAAAWVMAETERVAGAAPGGGA